MKFVKAKERGDASGHGETQHISDGHACQDNDLEITSRTANENTGPVKTWTLPDHLEKPKRGPRLGACGSRNSGALGPTLQTKERLHLRVKVHLRSQDMRSFTMQTRATLNTPGGPAGVQLSK